MDVYLGKPAEFVTLASRKILEKAPEPNQGILATHVYDRRAYRLVWDSGDYHLVSGKSFEDIIREILLENNRWDGITDETKWEFGREVHYTPRQETHLTYRIPSGDGMEIKFKGNVIGYIFFEVDDNGKYKALKADRVCSNEINFVRTGRVVPTKMIAAVRFNLVSWYRAPVSPAALRLQQA